LIAALVGVEIWRLERYIELINETNCFGDALMVKSMMKYVVLGGLVAGSFMGGLGQATAQAQNAQWNALFDRIIRLEARVKNMSSRGGAVAGRSGVNQSGASSAQMRTILNEIRQMRQELRSMDARLRRLEKNSGRSGRLVPPVAPRRVSPPPARPIIPAYPRQTANNPVPFDPYAPTNIEEYDPNNSGKIFVEMENSNAPARQPARPNLAPPPTNWQTGTSTPAPATPYVPPANPTQVVGLPPSTPSGTGIQRGTLDGNQLTKTSLAKRLFNRASVDLRARRYGSAEAGFKSFLRKYPSDRLASNAQFMLGETYYVQKSYSKAAQTYIKGYRKYPKGRKAGAMLLKLGMSLRKLGQKQQSCAAFEAVTSKYKKSSSIARQAKKEMRRAGC